ncbi:MAG TPA: GvpL/GvpF family gas vesicle protein [Pyrinomonadaceae bacterium]|nr:GvpL/GvpF family gas vesicle protein [Pyrinomonadaceae bacterium]
MSLYVYCLGRELAGKDVESLAGVGGATVRALECGGLTAVVSDFDEGRVALKREYLRAHNAVLAHVLAQTTPLPFRFGTLADAPQLAAYVSKNRDALASSLERVAGCVEMSVKVLWDEVADAQASRAGAPASPASETLTESESSETSAADSETTSGAGAAFLAAKRAALAGGERRRARADEISSWVGARLAPHARSARSRVSPEERIVLRASHLVESARVEEYREAVRRLGEEGGAGLRFLASGPWPPYSFCDLRP